VPHRAYKNVSPKRARFLKPEVEFNFLGEGLSPEIEIGGPHNRNALSKQKETGYNPTLFKKGEYKRGLKPQKASRKGGNLRGAEGLRVNFT